MKLTPSCLLVFLAYSCATEPPRPAAWESVEGLAQRFAEQGNPGVAVAVTDRRGLVWQGAFGHADQAARLPVTPETLFEIGSITKGMTAVALMTLADEGKLDPEAPVSRYLPWLRLETPDDRPVLVRHLLTHTAALPPDRDDLPSSLYQALALAGARTEAPAGTRFRYSNTGYLVLGAIASALDGRPFPEVLERRVLRPLGMTTSAPAITAAVRPRLAVGYVPFYDDRPLPPGGRLAPAPWIPWDAGDGGVAATAGDLAAYARFLLRGGEGPTGRVLSEAAFARLTKGEIASPHRAGALYAFGINVSREGGHTVLYHSGGMIGYRAVLLADATAGVAAVVLTNGPANPLPLAEHALAAAKARAAGEPPPPLPAPVDPRRIATAADYAGTFRAPDGRALVFAANGELLDLVAAGKRWPLSLQGTDTFLTDHPGFALFPFVFGRQDGAVAEVAHGGDWYRTPAWRGPEGVAAPGSWRGYVGHYRTNNPWAPNFRVVLLQGELWSITPAGHRQRLAPMGEGRFRAADPDEVEDLAFSHPVDGRAQKVLLNGVAYFRDESP